MTEAILVLVAAVLVLQVVTLVGKWLSHRDVVGLLRAAIAAAEAARINRKESVIAKDAVVDKVEEKARELTTIIPDRTAKKVLEEVKKSGDSGTLTPDGKPL